MTKAMLTTRNTSFLGLKLQSTSLTLLETKYIVFISSSIVFDMGIAITTTSPAPWSAGPRWPHLATLTCPTHPANETLGFKNASFYVMSNLSHFPPGDSRDWAGVVESVSPVTEELFGRRVLMRVHSAPPEVSTFCHFDSDSSPNGGVIHIFAMSSP